MSFDYLSFDFTLEHDLVTCLIYFMDFVSLRIFYGMYVGSMFAFLDQFDPLYLEHKCVLFLFPCCCLVGYYVFQVF